MIDFIISAIPFISIGICLAIIFSNHKNNKKTYISEGMCLGISLGIVISTMFNINLGLGNSIGMLAGETLGSFINKEK